MMYIQLDENKIVFNVGETTANLVQSEDILIGDYDNTYLGKKYIDGAFIGIETEENTIT